VQTDRVLEFQPGGDRSLTSNLQGKRVLIVEDDVLLLMSLQDMVTTFGCTIANSAMAVGPALQMARDPALDLAILDINLCGKLVTPVAEMLASRGVPFIFASGYDAQMVPSVGERPRVSKPYTSNQIRTALLAALAAPAFTVPCSIS
jgi:CheY-like chemotaxis protein